MRKTFWGILFLCSYQILFAQETSSGKISGYMFGDYFYNVLRDSTLDNINNKALFGNKDINGFSFRRIYFTYDYQISEKFNTRFRLESQSVVGAESTLFQTYIKDAYLNWKNIFEGSNLIFGIQPPPTFTISESMWGYRSLERTIMDLRKIANSRDFGVSLKGKVTNSGSVNYWLMFANGSVYESENDKFKRIYAHLDFLPSKNFRITVYGDYKFKPKKAYYGEGFNNDALVTSLFIGYQVKKSFSVGLETFLQTNYNDVSRLTENTLTVKDRNVLGISTFGHYNFSENLVGILRYDYFDSNISGDYKGDSRNFFLAGLDFKLHDKVSIIPNLEFETYETPVNGVSIDPSLTARVTFYYEFL
ncbi:MAG: hypothetical protein WAV89_04830 [Ignavibacteriaceae bacterium]